MTSLATPSLMTAPTTFNITNPYDGKTVGELLASSDAEVLQAIIRAKKAAKEFRHSMPFERRAILNKLADLIALEAESLAQTVCLEMGKTIREARNEIRRAGNTLRLSGDAATFLNGETMHCGIVEGGANKLASITYEPVGVIAAITPFNYPVNLLCHKLGPALAAGNAVIVKPSPKAPLSPSRIVELCELAGAPKDLVQVVHGFAEPAVALARGPIDLLSFTGGAKAGLALKNASGLVRCLMELGGNDPLFVMPDADLEAAADTAIGQRFEIAGQSCAAVKKLYVHHDIEDKFTEMLLARIEDITLGHPSDESTVMGPVIDEAAAIEVNKRVKQAVDAGATLRTGGWIEKSQFAPTLLTGMSNDMQIYQEETFGPILAMRSFFDIEDAVAEVNASSYGLQAGIYTNDHVTIKNVSRLIKVGGVMVNEGPDFRAEHVPFGGIKMSGLGREGIRITVREMSETKVVID
ncbi:aldehyde dehydrogenase family protein [uncultured Cohaesibacter sp.]|uniref:aldehyde dehydrogenase family protein n=1 Tax=uncultured Cohaesibacter sp. TaxID=1002546 RepID=UPI0029C6531F|nr:aldehyde dehydrogenase family protein [uncultured Cohaesibacter sp.]